MMCHSNGTFLQGSWAGYLVDGLSVRSRCSSRCPNLDGDSRIM